MRPPIPPFAVSRRTKILIGVVVALIVLIVLAVKFSGVYINWLWFGEVGHRNVYTTMFWTRVVLFFVFGAVMALIIGGNIVAAYLSRPPFRPMSPEQQNLQRYVNQLEPRRVLVLTAVAVIAFLSAGASAQGDWATWQLFLNGGSFGQTDPQFHLDIGFYAFDYPAYRLLLGFGFTAVIFSLILSVGVHYLTGAIRLQTPGPKFTIAARRHVTILIFVFMLLKAAAYWLDRYGFVFSDRSKFTGASYADVHAALPAKTILFWITLILALMVLGSLWLRSAVLPGIGFIVMMVLSVLMSGLYPAIVQSVTVNPNASDKEAPYIARNINATRDAYGIQTVGTDRAVKGSVTYVPYPANGTPDATTLPQQGAGNATLDNIRILDPAIVSATFLNTQKIGLPYAFSGTLDVDRYTLPDPLTKAQTEHDYIVAVREQAVGSNLSGSQNNWINQHTVYTHGYGFVAAQADQDVTNGDKNSYTEGDIPPTGALDIKQPDVYYGQLGNNYSIVGAKGTPREFDANGGSNVTYQGKGGIKLDNFFTRLAFAANYGETNFILNSTVSASGAKIIINRDPKQRVEKVAPFLTVDGDPFPFVDSKTGHIMWMVDGYTTMANYPYSERSSLSDLTNTSVQPGQADQQINYIRNSVKATVDAYDGTVKLYAWNQVNQPDPVLKAWMRVFPGLVQPQSAMPSEVLAHVRYPQDLFNVQRGLLAQYHISDPVAAYNGRGKWAVPDDPFSTTGASQPAYYILANDPADPNAKTPTPQFQLTSPMVVNAGQNLAAYISVDSDPGPNYGKMTVLQVQGGGTIVGPAQVANVFKTEDNISKDISLFNQSQSQVLHGNLLTLPVGNSFLYVEPLYIQATGGGSAAFPRLQRVLVTYGNKAIGYNKTLTSALDDLRNLRTPGASLNLNQGTPSTPSTSPSPSPSSSGSSSPPTTSPSPSTSSSGTPAPTVTVTTIPPAQSQLLADLASATQAQQAALKSGNASEIASTTARLQSLIDEYQSKYGSK
ncbi:MAG: UPF0182 family membrane protein [Jatrophihabitans sp.]|uniref:UPF0182 family membrane protein n=1 Tax=Jatrophihabitans sp. TaxID=1932789 RepID=UPI003F820FB6